MQPEEEIKKLEDAVRAVHGCEAHDLGRMSSVRELFNGHVAWAGYVRHFRLVGHPKADLCYAWSYRDGKETKVTTVLKIPPVGSAATAVKAAIAAKARA